MKNYLFVLLSGLILLTGKSHCVFAQNQTVNGQFVVTGNTYLKTLSVDGNFFLGSPSAPKQLNVDGNTFFHNDLTVDKAVRVGGDLVASGNSFLKYLSVDGNLFIGGTTTPRSLSLYGGAFLHNDLQVDGTATIANNLFVKGGLSVEGGTLNIGTAASPKQLQAYGTGFFFNQLNAYGNTFIGRPNAPAQLNVDGNTFLHQTLIVDGSTVLGGRTLLNISPTLQDKYKLFVEKGVVSEDYVIAPTAQWADYVFEDTYKRPALKDVEKYIKENKHLEGVPSAADVAKDGYSMRDVNVTLLKKIEELTLYSIEYDKKLAEQDKKINAQQQQMEQLKAQLEQQKLVSISNKKS